MTYVPVGPGFILQPIQDIPLYRVIIFSFTGIVNDGRELKYRIKKVDFEAVLEN